MGTRCHIAKKIGDNKYRTIFCQLDGYPEYCGAILLDAYNTPDKLDELLSLGDIYKLGLRLSPSPGEPHGESHRQKDITVAYARDFREEMIEAEDMTLDQLDDFESSIEFVYIFDEDGVWKFFEAGESDYGLRSVKEVLDTAFPDIASNSTGGYFQAIMSHFGRQDLASPNLTM